MRAEKSQSVFFFPPAVAIAAKLHDIILVENISHLRRDPVIHPLERFRY
jgi:hypothetical protein